MKRELIPDVKYNSELVARLINTIMNRGKKSTAQQIVYGAFDVIQAKKPEMQPLDVFLQALENVKPKLEVKSRRVGGASYSRGRKGKSMTDSLAGELLDAFENTGSSIKKKEDTFKMAQANKAFAHYRW